MKKFDEKILQDEKYFKEQVELDNFESDTNFIESTGEDNMIEVFGELGGGGDKDTKKY